MSGPRRRRPGIVTVADGGISFRHALVRRSAGARHPAQLRRTAYLALAEAAGPHASRARYRAAAALDPMSRSPPRSKEPPGTRRTPSPRRPPCNRLPGSAPACATAPDGWPRHWPPPTSSGTGPGGGQPYEEFTRIDADAETTFLAATAMSTALSLSSFQEEAFDLLLDVSERTLPGDGSLTLALASLAAAVADQSALPQHRNRLAALLARTEGRTRAGWSPSGRWHGSTTPRCGRPCAPSGPWWRRPRAPPPGSCAGSNSRASGPFRTVRACWSSGWP